MSNITKAQEILEAQDDKASKNFNAAVKKAKKVAPKIKNMFDGGAPAWMVKQLDKEDCAITLTDDDGEDFLGLLVKVGDKLYKYTANTMASMDRKGFEKAIMKDGTGYQKL